MLDAAEFNTVDDMIRHHKEVRKRLFAPAIASTKKGAQTPVPNKLTFLPRFVFGRKQEQKGRRDFLFIASFSTSFDKSRSTKSTIQDIMKDVIEQRNINADILLSECRSLDLVTTRALIAYRLRNELALSYKQIGKVLKRDHTSVMNLLHRFDKNGLYKNKNYCGAFGDDETKLIIEMIRQGSSLDDIHAQIPNRPRSSIRDKVRNLIKKMAAQS